ncbi:hypothetical protein J6S88_06615 [bacterium]|nr:hypothetical protein [bacterium]
MEIRGISQNSLNFKGAGINAVAFLEENVMLNKALLDASVDVPFVCFANNKTERKERLRRVSVNYSLCFLSPFLTLPLTNRLAMKYIAKLTPKLSSKESNLIHISNKYLKDKELLKEGIKLLSKEKNTDYSQIIKNNGGDFEKIRRKLINAKNAVLSFDFLFSSGSVSGMAFLNNYLTKKKTQMDGYSAEFELADRELVEKRAAKYKKSEPWRKGTTIALIAMLTALPLAIRKGLISPKTTGIANFIKDNAHLFDYTNGIFMKRFPLFLFLTVAMTGVASASRNRTELKNNLLINATGLAVYFGGDLLINSALAKLSDNIFKTSIIDKNAPKTFMNKIIPPTVRIRELTGKSKKIAAINFIINFLAIAVSYGYGIPKLMNKIIRKDLKTDADKQVS